MSPQQNTLSHNPVTPTTTSSMASTPTPESSPGAPSSFLKPSFFSWKVLGGIFATVLVVGWVFIIVILIQEEKWQLVLVAWLLLYAAAHFCYWYFKRHHLLSIQSQICGRTRGSLGTVRPMEKGSDAPPSYEDIIKSEPPPPAYYSVVEETPKSSQKSSTPTRFPRFSLQGLPRVFGRSSSPSSPSSSSASVPVASTSTNCSSSTISTLKQKEKEKSHPCCSSYNPPPSISGSLPEQSYNWKPRRRDDPPSYSDSFVDAESRVITPRAHTPSSLPSVSRTESVINEALHPIFSPIYKNNNNDNSEAVRPNTSRESIHTTSSVTDAERERNCSTPNG